ncbi:MAG: helix-turn-helix transcriptional regulator [Caldilineaceae bacterium]|nr:helix-turn-helix transcriptional regulator [Caldilineaceae bacterium]
MHRHDWVPLFSSTQRQDRSASWLAQRLDVSLSTVARWLNHDTRPGTATMVTQVAEVLGIAARRQERLVAVYEEAGYDLSTDHRQAPPRPGNAVSD